MKSHHSLVAAIGCAAILTLSMLPRAVLAQNELDRKLEEAAATVTQFTGEEGIPQELVDRAYGIAVIPNVIRGGFIFGGRRGKGALVVRTANSAWSNPSFILLTGGSIGWQIGAESADLILVFANEAAVRNIETGKFTLSGDASAVAGPVGRRSTAALTFKAEVYAYVQSKGLFAGAALEGARLALDAEANRRFYEGTLARPLETQNNATPASARRFLLGLEELSLTKPPPGAAPPQTPAPDTNDAPARTFPLGGAE
jgi:lipid-binding SYLF domain-containing protein